VYIKIFTLAKQLAFCNNKIVIFLCEIWRFAQKRTYNLRLKSYVQIVEERKSGLFEATGCSIAEDISGMVQLKNISITTFIKGDSELWKALQ